MEVVLPDPLTPATITTSGRDRETSNRPSAGAEPPSSSSRSARRTSSCVFRPVSLMPERSASISCAASVTPTSARNQCRFEVFKEASSTTPPENSPTMLTRVFVRPRLELEMPAAFDGVRWTGTYHASDGRESRIAGALQTRDGTRAPASIVSCQCNKAGSHADGKVLPASARAGAQFAGAPQHVRIIGGIWKRTPLPVANLTGLRPTPDRVRETLFNWMHHSAPESRRCRAVSICSPAPARSGSNWPPAVRALSLWSRATAQRWHQLTQHRANGCAADQIEIIAGDALSTAGTPAGGVHLNSSFSIRRFDCGCWLAALRSPLLGCSRATGLLYVESGGPLDDDCSAGPASRSCARPRGPRVLSFAASGECCIIAAPSRPRT